MEARIANPRALGFASFGMGVWMYSMVNAHWFSGSVLGSSTMGVVAMATTLGLLIAALASFLRNDHWVSFFFMFWAAVWWGIHSAASGAPASAAFAGWFDAALAGVSLILFLGALRNAEAPEVRMLSLGATLALASWALGLWGLGTFFVALAGYLGLLTALFAYWACLAEGLGTDVWKGDVNTEAGAATSHAGVTV